MISFVIHVSTVVYFIINPVPEKVSQSDINRVQKQFASLVLDRDQALLAANRAAKSKEIPVSDAEKKASQQTDETKKKEETTQSRSNLSGRRSSSGSKSTSGGAGKQGPSSGRNVANQGLLGILTAGTAATAGRDDAVADILSDEGVSDTDFDEIISNVDGLKKGGGKSIGNKSKAGKKGARVTKGGNIDNLLSDLGTATTKEVKRSDGLVHGKLSPMTMTDDKGNEVLLSGTRDPEKVSRIVNSHTDAIQYCYLREVKRNPNLRGKVVVRFTIRPDGTVSDVKILSTTLRSDSAERCIISRIKRWDDFDPIDPGLGDATFRQVYTFGF